MPYIRELTVYAVAMSTYIYICLIIWPAPGAGRIEDGVNLILYVLNWYLVTKKFMCIFYLSQNYDSPFNRNPGSWKTTVNLPCIINDLAGDSCSTQEARARDVLVLTLQKGKISRWRISLENRVSAMASGAMAWYWLRRIDGPRHQWIAVCIFPGLYNDGK